MIISSFLFHIMERQFCCSTIVAVGSNTNCCWWTSEKKHIRPLICNRMSNFKAQSCTKFRHHQLLKLKTKIHCPFFRLLVWLVQTNQKKKKITKNLLWSPSEVWFFQIIMNIQRLILDDGGISFSFEDPKLKNFFLFFHLLTWLGDDDGDEDWRSKQNLKF